MKINIRIIILILIVLLLASIHFNSFKDGLTGPENQPVYSIIKDKKCLDSETLTMTTCSTSKNLLWYSSQDSNFNKIKSYSSGECLSTFMDISLNYDVMLEPCENVNKQRWSLPPANATFQNNFTGNSCLDISFNKLYMSNDTCGGTGKNWSLHTH